jgi:hypothetical protein
MDPVQEGAIFATGGPQALDRRRVVIDEQTLPAALVQQHRGEGLFKLRENVEHTSPPSEEVPDCRTTTAQQWRRAMKAMNS